MKSETTVVSVISPGRRTGNTSIALIMGQVFAMLQGKKTCITHSGINSDSLNTFLGSKEIKDKTQSFEQMVSLVKNNLLTGDELTEYCTQFNPNLYVLDTASNTMDEENKKKMVLELISLLNFEIVIVDIDSELWEPHVQSIIKKSDFVIVVLEQAVDTLSKFGVWKDSDAYSVISSTEYQEYFVLNRFNSKVNSMQEFIYRSGIDKRYTTKISYNEVFPIYSNKGKFPEIITKIINKDPAVELLSNELKALFTMLANNIGFSFRDWTRADKTKEKDKSKTATVKLRSGREVPIS